MGEGLCGANLQLDSRQLGISAYCTRPNNGVYTLGVCW